MKKTGMSKKDLIEYIAKRLVKMEDHWIWTGACDSKGYPHTYIDGKVQTLSRVIWELLHGPIPEGLEVCHKCDIRNCCTVEHLFLGTHAENMRDMAKKGRTRGKLTLDDIERIKNLYSQKVSITDISAMFNTTINVISRIVHNKNYVYIAK